MPEPSELERLRALLEQLSERVSRLEQTVGRQAAGATPVAPAKTTAPVRTPAAPPPEPSPPLPRLPLPPRPARPAAPEPRPEQDLESVIGSQWLNRVGIIAVLIGVSYFLKYAFDNNWIGPAGRISIGLIAGIAVVLWSERFRAHGHHVFSLSLKAVGIGTLYLSVWGAFQLYHLVPASAAFLAMIIVTAATATLAITQNAQVLAALALVGGFATPILLSTGQNREIVLFSYIVLLDVATLVLVIIRPWRLLLGGAFVGTVALYIGWYFDFYGREQLARTLIFASIFFVIFALAPLLAALKPTETHRVPHLLLVLPLVNASAFFLELHVMLHEVSRAALAWTAVGLAAVYLILSRQVQARVAADEESAKELYLIHVALAVGFLTTAIPLKLETHWITIGWLVESAVLLWIGYRAASGFLKSLATVALLLGIIRLLLVDNFEPDRLVLNARFITYVIAIAALAWGVWLAKKSGSAPEQSAAAVGIVAINVLALVALSREVDYYFDRQLLYARTLGAAATQHVWQDVQVARSFGFSALWMAYGAVLMWVGFWKRSAFLRWQALALLTITVGKVFIYDVSQLERGYRIISFICLGVLLLVISFAYQRDWLKLSRPSPAETKEGSTPL